MSKNEVVEYTASAPVVHIPNVDHLADMVEVVEKAKERVLKDGLDQDYAVIPGTGNKPTLLKPGAEKLCQLFGYRIKEMNLEDEWQNGQVFGVRYKCVLHDSAERIVGVCDGAADTGERKARSWDRNTLLKMAQKRAFVGAVLWATGSSALFTQDVEDLDQGEFSGRKAEGPSRNVSRKVTTSEFGVSKLNIVTDWWWTQTGEIEGSYREIQGDVHEACKALGYKNSDDLAQEEHSISRIQAWLNDHKKEKRNDRKERQIWAESGPLVELVRMAKAAGKDESWLWSFLQEQNVNTEADLSHQKVSALKKKLEKALN